MEFPIQWNLSSVTWLYIGDESTTNNTPLRLAVWSNRGRPGEMSASSTQCAPAFAERRITSRASCAERFGRKQTNSSSPLDEGRGRPPQMPR